MYVDFFLYVKHDLPQFTFHSSNKDPPFCFWGLIPIFVFLVDLRFEFPVTWRVAIIYPSVLYETVSSFYCRAAD